MIVVRGIYLGTGRHVGAGGVPGGDSVFQAGAFGDNLAVCLGHLIVGGGKTRGGR